MRYPSAMVLSTVLVLLCPQIAPGQNLPASSERSPRIANYRIAVALDPAQKTLTGQETLTWHNPSSDEIRELQFHLYLNAFKDSRSTFMKESGAFVRESLRAGEKGGSITISSMKTDDGMDHTSAIEFIHPDDDNAEDQTVIRVPLTKPIPPHGSIVLNIDFSAHLPQVIARTGYRNDFFMVGQWFPKVGVYEAAGQRYALQGGWNCHQFHANTEFYADFGVYDVDITVPSRFIVGATGVLQHERRGDNDTKTLSFHADDVHDFAWTASPHFDRVTGQWRNVQITVLMQPQRRSQAPRYLNSAKATLEFLDAHVGVYPYGTLTIVDPAYGAMEAGGMEYPTLITADTFWGLGEWARMAELATVHECGHQYWYGMVASNEFEEAWLDEGVTHYYETRIMDETYGRKVSLVDIAGFHLDDLEFSRSLYRGMSNPRVAPIATPAWKFPSGYGALTYQKTGLVLGTLERMVGRAVMDSAFRTYFDRWKFKHPSGKDFLAVFNEVVPRLCGTRWGKDLNWFFDQTLYGTGVCDYEVTSLRTRRERDSTQAVSYESTVFVSRLGDMQLPVALLVRFKNGEEVREEWDGKDRTKTFTYRRGVAAVSAQVDPDQVLVLDINDANNSKAAVPEQSPFWKYTFKFLFLVQNIFSSLFIAG